MCSLINNHTIWLIVWQRFCEPARLRIAHCLSVLPSVRLWVVRHLISKRKEVESSYSVYILEMYSSLDPHKKFPRDAPTPLKFRGRSKCYCHNVKCLVPSMQFTANIIQHVLQERHRFNICKLWFLACCTSKWKASLVVVIHTWIFIFQTHLSMSVFLAVHPSACLSVCLSVWVYSGHIIHHFNGIWGTCAPGRRNMHHQGAICTTVHKGDYVF